VTELAEGMLEETGQGDLAIKRGDVKAKLDILPTDTFGEELVKPPRKPRLVTKARKHTHATKSKPLAHKKMARVRQSKSSQPHSDGLKATQSDFVQPAPHPCRPRGPRSPCLRPHWSHRSYSSHSRGGFLTPLFHCAIMVSS
jgi:hypothetical protein